MLLLGLLVALVATAAAQDDGNELFLAGVDDDFGTLEQALPPDGYVVV